ncbi:uncharacterized protein CIMG_01907 [Coccidioides immitis RS]|uniref:Uncharacterized protein n=4 Tax=Coccidioides immitis TaxID=5501 RepID=A0A0E1S034_COCIM|nr:uncharacterized protein CIMG_01907 [Coccidioides immitis RS]EAS36553.1 hypothetical protein CIMG_01907 [Coccidioides immitis RS]KMP01914.1 hypothetical protein CIRG_02053 [Coccidioides immitis RMSCC 2394]KMU73007.1 hypothetical protein CISG_09888 [Coccidioides immitis RMSCC 3703]KMU90325.1 hypothetical protein CIHG_08134 [Coccidioides immitis H538.4]
MNSEHCGFTVVFFPRSSKGRQREHSPEMEYIQYSVDALTGKSNKMETAKVDRNVGAGLKPQAWLLFLEIHRQFLRFTMGGVTLTLPPLYTPGRESMSCVGGLWV